MRSRRFPPLSNATLARVQAGGGAEDYDAASAAGPEKWVGAARAFVNDQASSDDGARGSSVVLERTIVVDDALDVDWQRGDIVTYTYRGATQTGEIRDIKITSAQGVPGVARLTLRPS
jgi:hypothetical protein